MRAETYIMIAGGRYKWSDLKENKRVLPPEDIYPMVPPGTTIASLTFPLKGAEYWLKRPNFFDWTPECRGVRGGNSIASTVEVEIHAYEYLHSLGLDGIAKYHGVIMKEHRAVAIALKRYPSDLDEWPLPPSFKERLDIYTAGEKTIYGLHKLGFAHNDLKPKNIVMDEAGTPLPIDLEGCRKLGESLRKMGTRTWNEGFVHISSTQNDRIGLEKLKTYLRLDDHE